MENETKKMTREEAAGVGLLYVRCGKEGRLRRFLNAAIRELGRDDLRSDKTRRQTGERSDIKTFGSLADYIGIGTYQTKEQFVERLIRIPAAGVKSAMAFLEWLQESGFIVCFEPEGGFKPSTFGDSTLDEYIREDGVEWRSKSAHLAWKKLKEDILMHKVDADISYPYLDDEIFKTSSKRNQKMIEKAFYLGRAYAIKEINAGQMPIAPAACETKNERGSETREENNYGMEYQKKFIY